MHNWFDRIFPISGWPIAIIILATQFIASYIVNLISYKQLSSLYRLFKPRKFEKGGTLYQRVFHIKAWKEYIPSVSSFDKKNLEVKLTPDYVAQYLLEGLRAELCHEMAIVMALVVLLASTPKAWFFIIVYTILLNIPCLMIQRYNRPRFERLVRTRDEKGNIVLPPFYLKDSEDGRVPSGREERDQRRAAHKQAKKEKAKK